LLLALEVRLELLLILFDAALLMVKLAASFWLFFLFITPAALVEFDP
jgi:hypothetical protein